MVLIQLPEAPGANCKKIQSVAIPWTAEVFHHVEQLPYDTWSKGSNPGTGSIWSKLLKEEKSCNYMATNTMTV
jgi:hypothetical protein